ncbi:YveK family protein [Clostridium akagii]|uniref:YveK family protein n=1 Tax=Clostridium akagii TaxID=91623 RepID=UPI00047B5884|nr:Wzz/FepE/Etk N-terminal domain-containing protein [Clostridium akagii]
MNEATNIDISQMYYVLAKRKSIIIVITLVFTIIAGIVNFFIMSPVYESMATVIVGSKSDATTNSSQQYNDVMMYQNLTKTYSTIATSSFIEGKAAEKIGNGMTAIKLSKMITVTPEDGTQIIDITADANTADEALNDVTALSNSFVKNANEVYNAGEIKIMDAGELPKAPIKPNKKLNIAVVFILGIFVSVGLSFLLEFMDSTIKTPEDIKKYLDLPVLGTIPMQDEV